jgi:hypothetical protein
MWSAIHVQLARLANSCRAYSEKPYCCRRWENAAARSCFCVFGRARAARPGRGQPAYGPDAQAPHLRAHCIGNVLPQSVPASAWPALGLLPAATQAGRWASWLFSYGCSFSLRLNKCTRHALPVTLLTNPCYSIPLSAIHSLDITFPKYTAFSMPTSYLLIWLTICQSSYLYTTLYCTLSMVRLMF